jgi:hypothetical protein
MIHGAHAARRAATLDERRTVLELSFHLRERDLEVADRRPHLRRVVGLSRLVDARNQRVDTPRDPL